MIDLPQAGPGMARLGTARLGMAGEAMVAVLADRRGNMRDESRVVPYD